MPRPITRPISRSTWATCLHVWILFTATLFAQPDPPRIDPAEAIKQLTKRVEPEIPEMARRARIYGLVTAEIVVGLTGSVERVRVIKDVPLLSGAAADAIRQWEFRPFVIGGKPSRILTEVIIDFPKPADPDRDAEQVYYKAAINCRTLLDARASESATQCAAIVQLADALPADNWERRSEARFLAAQSAMTAGKFPAAVTLLEESLPLWLKHDPAHIMVAQHHLLIALSHQSNQDPAKASDAFARALKEYEDQLAAGRPLDRFVAAELQVLLTNYAEVRRALKDETGARTLESRAAKIPGAVSAAPATPRRAFGSLVCFGVGCLNLSDADVSAALRQLPAGTRPWFIDGGPETPRVSNLTLYVEHEREFSGLRRGRTIALTRGRSDQWEAISGLDSGWAQVTSPGGPSGDLPDGYDDPRWPFLITPVGNAGTISDDDLQAIVGMVRAAGETTRSKNLPEPRRLNDVQPWPIGNISQSGSNEVRVLLRSPERGGLPQVLTLTREDKAWRVTSIR